MKTYYRIVPRGDGYTYLALENGEYVLKNKNGDNDFSLLFKNKPECNDYIKENLNTKEYKAEEVGLDERYFDLK